MFSNIKFLTSNRIEFTISGIDLAYVNAVRRIIQSEIPTISFYFDPYHIEKNEIIIHENTTSLHNEFTAHRVSLIPLFFDENEVNEFDRSRYNFVLKKSNKSTTTQLVTTEDFKIFEDNKELSKQRKEKILPKNAITGDFILITKLKPNLYNIDLGDSINLECVPSKSIGKVHSRWSPVSQCCFYNVVDKKKAKDAFETLKQENPQKTNEELHAVFDTLDIHRHFKTNEFDEPDEFMFKIETECNLRPTYLFFKGLLILKEKLSGFISSLKASHDEKVEIKQQGNVENLFQISIKDEDHTLLNTLQCIIYNNEIRSMKATSLIYIGYYQPHPLDNVMFLKLKFEGSDIDVTYVRNFMIASTTQIIEEVNTILHEWVKVSELNKTDIKEVAQFLSA